MVVCVIGGAGFLGRRVVRLLAARGHEVVCADIKTGDFFEDLGSQVRMIHADLTQFEDIAAAMVTHKPEVVINLSYMLGDYLPRPAMKVNILGMDNCFEAARLCGVRHVVYASSIAVNGSQSHYGNRKIKETDPTTAAKQYAVHKVFNEWQAKEYREKHGMCITGVRPGNVAGIDKVLGSVDHVQCIVKPALGQRGSFPYRDRMRCVVYVDDMAEIFTRIALSEKPAHTVYNSGGETLSLGQIADIVRKFIPEADITFESETGGVDASGGYMFDNERVVKEFGIRFQPYEQRVAEMIEIARRSNTLR